MPQLAVKKATEVPLPSRTSRAIQEQQRLYEDFIRSVGSDVGELELSPGEQARGVKVRLRRASTRIGTPIEIWDADGRVYFKAENKARRGRPRKSGTT
jgi:hypothetical protein